MKKNTSKSQNKVTKQGDKNLKYIIENEKDSNKANIFGVIIGIHETIFDEDKKTFIKKIKILDDSFNYTQSINLHKLKFHKFITVSLYSKEKEDFKKLNKIGDIIWLRRFFFKLYPSGAYQGNEVEFSNWLVFDRESKQKLVPIAFKNIEKNNNRIFNEKELERVKVLRAFSSKFFEKHSMLFIDWFQDYNSKHVDEVLKEENSDLKSNRDLIGIIESKNKKQFSIKDTYGNIFILKENKNFKIKVNEVIVFKFINVTLKKNNNEIEFTDKSYIMNLPNYFYDFNYLTGNKNNKEFDDLKFENGDISFIKKKFPFLKDFNAESHHFINQFKIKKKNIEFTLIKDNYLNQDVKNLDDIVDNLKNLNKYKGKSFVIECKIESLAKGFENLNNIIKQYCAKCKKIENFNYKINTCCKKNMKISYNLIFNVKSNEKDSKTKQTVYMLSDDNNNYMFDTWRILPALNNENEWKKVKKGDLELFKKKLLEFVKKTPTVKIVVEIVDANKSGILKIKDTLFLPY